MTLGQAFSWGALTTFLAMMVFLGSAPVFAVRLIARIYPRGHDRRRELVGEMFRVSGLRDIPEQWRWLGESLAIALHEGLSERMQERGVRRSWSRGPWARREVRLTMELSDGRTFSAVVADPRRLGYRDDSRQSPPFTLDHFEEMMGVAEFGIEASAESRSKTMTVTASPVFKPGRHRLVADGRLRVFRSGSPP